MSKRYEFNIHNLNLLLKLVVILLCFCVFKINVNAAAVGDVTNFGYTGGIQTFTAPSNGYYKLEVWGGQGGHGGGGAGSGGYSRGTVLLERGETIYVVVGNQGNNVGSQGSNESKWYTVAGGYNGGGQGSCACGCGGGGGATHIAKVSGVLSSLSGQRDQVLIVAGGGGGGEHWKNGNQAGGHAGSYYVNGGAGSRSGSGGFGYGGSGRGNRCGGGGGGAGWSGGSGGGNTGSGQGGAGYANTTLLKDIALYGYGSRNDAANNSYSTSSIQSSPTVNAAKNGAGYARITIAELTNTNAKLSSLDVTNGTFDVPFDPDTLEYNVLLGSEYSNVDITATAEDEYATVSGTGNFDIPAGLSTYEVVSTSDAGTVLVYTLNITRIASPYKYLSDIKIDDESISGFSPTKLTYNLNVPYNVDILNLDIVKGRTSQTLYLPSDLSLKTGNNTFNITVISEDGNNSTTYTLNVNRAHSSYLKSITIENDLYDLDPEFDPETLNYNIDLMSSTLALKVNAVAYDEEATVTMSGFGYIKSTQVATITVTEPNSEKKVYNITLSKDSSVVSQSYNFPYRGYEEEFVAPAKGYYLLEVWGGQGGNGGSTGGYGAYTVGTIILNKNDVLYVNVGGQGASVDARWDEGTWFTRNGGYNGGGQAQCACGCGGGGGATQIALSSGLLTSFANKKSDLLVVASGGAGGSFWKNNRYIGGSGGGYANTSGTNGQYGAGGFGYGGSGRGDRCGGGAGGAGIQGGSGGANVASGRGGTGYFNSEELIDYKEYTRSMYCYNCPTSNAETTYTVKTGSVSSNPVSYYAKSGAGYARITLLPQPSENNFLSTITVKATDFETQIEEQKSYTPSFDKEVEDYYVTLTDLETSINLHARPEDSTAKIEGLGIYDVPAGTTTFEIKVTAEAGNEKVYKVHVTRSMNANEYPIDIQVAGLVPSLCGSSDDFCHLDPASFNKNTQTYYLTVPSRIKQLWFNVDKGHPYQTVNGDGKVTLKGGENTFTITVTSEDGQNHSVYNYIVTRDMTGNTDLSDLIIINPERVINYDPDILEYYFSIPNEFKTYQVNENNEIDDNLENVLQMYVTTDDPNASYVLNGPEEFVVGMNNLQIVVTAANGEVKTYVLNVYREQNTNVFLSDLSVQKNSTTYEMSPEFNKINTGVYNVSVPNNISDVDIIAHAEESSTTLVSGIGNKVLNTGNNSFNIVTTSESGDTETYKINIYREKNNNAYLSELHAMVSDVEKISNFNKETLEYSFDVNEGTTSIEISALPEVNTTTYRLLDNNQVRVGENRKRVMTVAEDGTSLIYTIRINRPSSTDNLLSSLIVSDSNKDYELSPLFISDETEYTLEVENEVSYVNVVGTKNNSLAQVTGNGRYNLKVGTNVVSISVTSESGSIKTYTITITRKPNSNPYLAAIQTSQGILIPSFDKEEYDYSINVDANVNEINIKGIPEVSTTRVTGNNTYTLTTGENEVILTTLAEDNVSSKTYTIKVNKAKSSNNYIRNLILKEGSLSPTFDRNVDEYSAAVPYSKDKAHFIVELEDSRSTYEIINDDLVVGENEVIVRVTSENNEEKDYTINITRLDEETSRNTRLLNLKTDVGTLDPVFDAETLYYEVEVDYDIKNITVTAETEVDYSNVSGTGTYSLNVGNNLITVKVTSVEGNTRDYQIMVIRKPNTEARLKTLNISGVELSPSFDSDVYEYDLETSENMLNFTSIVLIDSNATYEIVGNEFDEVGNYQVKIKTTAANGINKKEYKLNVNKLPSNNNNLISLSVEGHAISPTFSPVVTVYTLTVENSVNTINIIANSYDKNATIIGDGIQNVEVGVNYFTVEVTSESGKVKTYTIVVTKRGSDNNNLESLEVLNGTISPTYTNDNQTYSVNIPYEEESLDLRVVLSDEKASYIVVGNENLQVGQNLVKVLVTAEDGSIKTINLNVNRHEIVSPLLKNLKIKNYEISPNFNSYVFNYNVTVDNEINKLVFDEITTLDPSATYVIRNNENLSVGNNIIEIEVTSSNNIDKQIYTLNVNKQAYSNTYLDYLYTSKGDVNPTFDKTLMEYSIDVDYLSDEIELFAETIDKSAKVETIYNGVTREAVKDSETHKYNGELGKFNLQTGENKVTIKVTSTSGITRYYYVTINRAKNNNNYLSSLNAKIGATNIDISPEFNKATTSYTTNVPTGTKSINISAIYRIWYWNTFISCWYKYI